MSGGVRCIICGGGGVMNKGKHLKKQHWNKCRFRFTSIEAFSKGGGWWHQFLLSLNRYIIDHFTPFPCKNIYWKTKIQSNQYTTIFIQRKYIDLKYPDSGDSPVPERPILTIKKGRFLWWWHQNWEKKIRILELKWISLEFVYFTPRNTFPTAPQSSPFPLF